MRHYFFELGPENTIAFFEWKGASTFAKPAGMPSSRPMQFDHLSFNLPDEEALHAHAPAADRARVRGHRGRRPHDRALDLLHRPHGIALEASWWAIDATGRPADYGDKRLFSDPDPVPAVRELRDTGELAWMPTTTLTGDEVADPV